MRGLLAALVTVAISLCVAVPALAGGWAVVHLDEPPDDVRVDTPWRFGFTVLQHDVTPNSDIDAVITAIHQETGTTITATATPEGAVGHFVAELTLPLAGGWKWSIQPEPYAATTFDTLWVSGIHPASAATVARLLAGTCADGRFIAAKPPATTPVLAGDWLLSQPSPSSLVEAQLTIDGSLSELVATEHALAIAENAPDGGLLACGVVSGGSGAELAIGLQPVGDADTAGVAILRGAGERTEISLYLIALAPQPKAPAYSATKDVEIVGGEANMALFSPPTLAVEPGTRVTWTNRASSPHMVSIDDLAFDDSGWIEPGGSFSQIFAEIGTFQYRCGPHPWMTGTIVVG